MKMPQVYNFEQYNPKRHFERTLRRLLSFG